MLTGWSGEKSLVTKREKYLSYSTAEYDPTGDRVAIKKFFRPFQSTIHAKRTYRLVNCINICNQYPSNRVKFRELKLLRTLQHDNVLEMIDVFTPDTDAASLNNVWVWREMKWEWRKEKGECTQARLDVSERFRQITARPIAGQQGAACWFVGNVLKWCVLKRQGLIF